MSKLVPAGMRHDPLVAVFDDFFDDPWMRPLWPITSNLPDTSSVMRARMDVVDKGPSYAITVELPGVKKEDINVSVDGARVSITAETVRETDKKDGGKVIHSERFATSYARSFELPTEVTESGADAAFEDGVLKLTLPKRTPVEAKKLLVH